MTGENGRDLDEAPGRILELPCIAVRMNRKVAEAFSRETDARTTGDLGYAVKTTIAELGEFMRPWRVIGEEDGELILVGVARSAPPRAQDARRRGVAFEAFGVELRRDATMAFTLHANPTYTITLSTEADGRRRCATVDAAEGASDPAKAYLDWTRDRLTRKVDSEISIPDGLALEGEVAIGRIRRETVVRKVAGTSPARDALADAGKGGDPRVAVGVATTTCRATMRMRVVDPAIACRVISFGIGKGQGLRRRQPAAGRGRDPRLRDRPDAGMRGVPMSVATTPAAETPGGPAPGAPAKRGGSPRRGATPPRSRPRRGGLGGDRAGRAVLRSRAGDGLRARARPLPRPGGSRHADDGDLQDLQGARAGVQDRPGDRRGQLPRPGRDHEQRPRKLAEGAAPDVGAESVKGFNAFNEVDFCLLASPSRSLVATNVAPLREPPAHVEARLKRDVRPFDFVMGLLRSPPPAPFTAIHWTGRAAAIPIVPTTFAEVVVLNGGPEPVEIDRRRFRDHLEAARRIGGLAAMDDAVALREAIAERASHVLQRAGGKTRRVPVAEALAALKALRLNDLVATLRALPARGDVETRYVRAALRDEESRTARDAAGGETP